MKPTASGGKGDCGNVSWILAWASDIPASSWCPPRSGSGPVGPEPIVPVWVTPRIVRVVRDRDACARNCNLAASQGPHDGADPSGGDHDPEPSGAEPGGPEPGSRQPGDRE